MVNTAHTDRTGLYVIVLIILLIVWGMNDRTKRIEATVSKMQPCVAETK